VIFEPTSIEGCWHVRIEPRVDERGFFARTWCSEEFAAAGVAPTMVQASVSVNRYRGTLRGMHLARPPAREGKLVRCRRGRVHDVVLDLRPGSPSYLRHHAVVLDAGQHNALYVPPGVAHGFQTLVDEVEVDYMMTEAYQPALADGVRYDDPAFGIHWPLPVACIAEKDRLAPDFDAEQHARIYAAIDRGDAHAA
jgi:dTDP-4-dehydrorhamnose 3,5-epimerase